jgi:hypothetical protein
MLDEVAIFGRVLEVEEIQATQRASARHESGRRLRLTRRLEQSARQFPLPVHGPTKHQFVSQHFVEQDMFVERPKQEEEAPFAQAGVSQSAARPKVRALAKQLAGGLYRREVAIRDLPTGIDRVPFELALNVGDKVVRFPDVHALNV